MDPPLPMPSLRVAATTSWKVRSACSAAALAGAAIAAVSAACAARADVQRRPA